MILLSIVIPTKDEGDNLRALCESLLKQSYKEFFEVVIIDDSSPHYEEYVRSCINVLKDAGVGVKYLRGNGKGVGSAMLKGLEVANGEYVFCLDADNVLENCFMDKVVHHLMRGSFVSLLSKGMVEKGISALFYAEQLRAFLRGGLRLHKRYGFVNVLYIWRRNILLRESKLVNVKLSLLDQLNLKGLIREHAKLLNEHIHIDEILVKDIRHVFENFDIRFIYRRLLWYYRSWGGVKQLIKLKDVKILLSLPFIMLVLLLAFASVVGLINLMSIFLVYLTLLTTTIHVKTRRSYLQALIGTFWLPLLLLLKSVLTYYIILKRESVNSVSR